MRILQIEEPEELTLKVYLFTMGEGPDGDVSGYDLTEVSPRCYQWEAPDTIFGLYRIVIEIVAEGITTSIDSGYVNLGALDDTYVMSNELPVIELTSSDSTVYSEYGPKRVKTKEMEIEQFDPRLLNKINERADAVLPCFGAGPTCVGYNTNRRIYRRWEY